jgi:hypothetical protein
MGQQRLGWMVPGTIHRPLSMLPLLCARDARISCLHLGRIISTALPGPLPHMDQTFQRIIRRNGNNIKCNDTQQTAACTYINLREACCPGHLLRDSPSTHASSPQMDTTGGQPSTYPPIKRYHPQQTKGGQHARQTKGATGYSPAMHYKCTAHRDSPEPHQETDVEEYKANALTCDMQQHP